MVRFTSVFIKIFMRRIRCKFDSNGSKKYLLDTHLRNKSWLSKLLFVWI